MKHTIEWHKDCLKNRLTYIESIRKEISRLTLEQERVGFAAHELADQIALANKRGLTEFDANKLGKKTLRRTEAI